MIQLFDKLAVLFLVSDKQKYPRSPLRGAMCCVSVQRLAISARPSAVSVAGVRVLVPKSAWEPWKVGSNLISSRPTLPTFRFHLDAQTISGLLLLTLLRIRADFDM